MAISPRVLGIADRIDRCNAAVGRTAAWAALFIVLVHFLVVVLRYAFGIGSIWLTESIIYGHATLFMLAAAGRCAKMAVRVDIFYSEASTRTKAMVDFVGALAGSFPFMLVLLAFAVSYVGRSWAIFERSRETSGLPGVRAQDVDPAFAIMFALQGAHKRSVRHERWRESDAASGAR
jgi:TRAP-type mannitol/chloroaromatic compound transport system permease small subunit